MSVSKIVSAEKDLLPDYFLRLSFGLRLTTILRDNLIDDGTIVLTVKQ